MLEPTPMGVVTLRRYRLDPAGASPRETCPGPLGYHDASSGIVEIRDALFARWVGDRYEDEVTGTLPDLTGDDRWVHKGAPAGQVPHDDPAWPRACTACGYEFRDADEWQVNEDLLYRRADVEPGMEQPDLLTLRQAPAGAMWYAWWLPGSWRHQVGPRPIVVKLPDGHEWMPDMRATNCGRQARTSSGVGDGTDPDYREHFCWVVHGTPPDLTVDKQGVTCVAGAGSIASGGWHGFLRSGELVLA